LKLTKKDLQNFVETLKETSIDNHDNKNIAYMTESQLSVINFDDVKDNYIKGMGVEQPPNSNDVLFEDKNSNEYYFIEFKAGGIDPVKNVKIKFKIHDSLLILLDILDKTISFSRKSINYILVYNKNQIHKSKHFDTSKSKSKDKIKGHVFKNANKELIRFDLERYKNLYFKNVHTYTIEEFENNFVKKFDK